MDGECSVLGSVGHLWRKHGTYRRGDGRDIPRWQCGACLKTTTRRPGREAPPRRRPGPQMGHTAAHPGGSEVSGRSWLRMSRESAFTTPRGSRPRVWAYTPRPAPDGYEPAPGSLLLAVSKGNCSPGHWRWFSAAANFRRLRESTLGDGFVGGSTRSSRRATSESRRRVACSAERVVSSGVCFWRQRPSPPWSQEREARWSSASVAPYVSEGSVEALREWRPPESPR